MHDDSFFFSTFFSFVLFQIVLIHENEIWKEKKNAEESFESGIKPKKKAQVAEAQISHTLKIRNALTHYYFLYDAYMWISLTEHRNEQNEKKKHKIQNIFCFQNAVCVCVCAMKCVSLLFLVRSQHLPNDNRADFPGVILLWDFSFFFFFCSNFIRSQLCGCACSFYCLLFSLNWIFFFTTHLSPVAVQFFYGSCFFRWHFFFSSLLSFARTRW